MNLWWDYYWQENWKSSLSWKIYDNSLTYYFKSKKSSPIAFIGFDCPLYLSRKIKEGFIELEQLKENKKEFKSDLNKIVK